MTGKPGRRYPWPHRQLPTTPPNNGTGPSDGTMTAQHIADHLGITRRAIARYKTLGLPTHMADRLATHILGTHPALIWSDWYNDESSPQ